MEGVLSYKSSICFENACSVFVKPQKFVLKLKTWEAPAFAPFPRVPSALAHL